MFQTTLKTPETAAVVLDMAKDDEKSRKMWALAHEHFKTSVCHHSTRLPSPLCTERPCHVRPQGSRKKMSECLTNGCKVAFCRVVQDWCNTHRHEYQAKHVSDFMTFNNVKYELKNSKSLELAIIVAIVKQHKRFLAYYLHGAIRGGPEK